MFICFQLQLFIISDLNTELQNKSYYHQSLKWTVCISIVLHQRNGSVFGMEFAPTNNTTTANSFWRRKIIGGRNWVTKTAILPPPSTLCCCVLETRRHYWHSDRSTDRLVDFTSIMHVSTTNIRSIERSQG